MHRPSVKPKIASRQKRIEQGDRAFVISPLVAEWHRENRFAYDGLTSEQSVYAYVNNNPTNYTDPSGECPQCVGAVAGAGYGALAGGISGAIAGWNTTNSSMSRFDKFGMALIGAGAGALTGAAVGAAAGASLNPALAASAPISVAAGVVGSIFSNPIATSAGQYLNNQPIKPFENLNSWQEGGSVLTSAVFGAGAVGIARLGVGLASSSTSLVGGAPLAMPGSLVESVFGGIGAGVGETLTTRPSTSVSANTSYYSSMGTGGVNYQNLFSISPR